MRLCVEIKKWEYVEKKMTEETQKVNVSTIMSYINAPLIMSFGGTNEIIEKLILSQYHNGKFYFDKHVEISSEVIYKLTGLSNKGEPIPVGIKDGLIERLTGTLIGMNSKGLIIGKIKSTTPKLVAKIVFTGMIVTSRGCDLKLDMLEVVEKIVEKGKLYCWA